MKVCTCFLLFGIFAYTNTQKRHHRQLNLQIENAPKLTIDEYSEDTTNFNNVHNFITRETTTNKIKKYVFRKATVETLTDFIQEAVDILNTFEDTAFEDFFHILDSEIRKYHYGNCKFFEVMKNHDTRKFAAMTLKMVRDKPISVTKANINKMAVILKEETYNTDVKELLGYINSLYEHTEEKFIRVLNQLKLFKDTKTMKNHNSLARFIRHAVRVILFDHYTELDIDTRNELVERIEEFWKRYKSNPATVDKVYNSHEIINAENESVTETIQTKEVKKPKTNLKTDLRNKIYSSVSIETSEEQSDEEETEKAESSSESEEQKTNFNADDISSGQSLDSSSNSIKQSQERHVEYNTERYMTLYTEEIAYKARITNKTEIKPIASNDVMKSSTIQTTATPRYSSEDESDSSNTVEVLRTNHNLNDTKLNIPDEKIKLKPRTVEDDHKQRKQFKPYESKSKSKHTNTHIIGEYNAVIDVQLANTELLNALGIFKPVMDKNSRYSTKTSRRTVKKIKPVKAKLRAMRAVPQVRKNNKNRTPRTTQKTAHTKPPLRHSKSHESLYLKPVSKLRTKTLKLLPKDIYFIRETIQDEKRKQHLTRRSGNGTGINIDFNTYIIKRIDALEKDLTEFKSTLFDKKFKEVKVNNVTEKAVVKGNDYVAKLLEKYQNLNKKDNNTEANSTINTESTSNVTTISKPSESNKDAVNTTVIEDKNATQVTNNNVNDTKELNKDKVTNSETTVTVSSVKITDATALKYSVTTTTTRYTKSDVSDIKNALDHVNDGLDLNM